MQALKTITLVMAVMIVVGTATLAVLIVRRLAIPAAGGAGATIRLDEPPASEIAAIASEGPGQLALLLRGGGPDRVVVVDLASGKVRARIGISR